MHSDSYENIILYLVEQAEKLLEFRRITDGITQIDYVAIFPKDEQEKTALENSLKTIAMPVKVTPTGTIYKLGKPVQTLNQQVQLLKIHTVDPTKTQRGYVDYQVADYALFKRMYLMSNAVESTQNASGMEMLTAEQTEVSIFFPETPFGKDLI